jgi:hypothetical protein
MVTTISVGRAGGPSDQIEEQAMRWRTALLPVFVASVMSVPALAQDQGGDGGNRGGDNAQQGDRGPGGDRGGRRGGGGGNFNPEEFRQRMMDRFKEQLGVNDEEWQVLQPKVERVLAAQRDTRAGGGMGFGGRGGGGPGGFGGGPGGGGRGGDGPDTELGRASRELRTLIQSEGASAEDIASRLAAFRAARDKANAELAAARTELKELVTQRQEAVLVMAGLLE